MRTHIVYIPGLGSRYNGFRAFALKFWGIYGVSAKLIPLDWFDSSSFEQKMDRIKQFIDQVDPTTSRVVVIGESAGATLALRAANLPSVHRVITLCGVTQPATPISSYLQKKSPALLQATRLIPDTSKQDVRSIRAVSDSVVNKKYSIASGAKAHVIWTVGHFTTIVLCLTILSPLMLTIAKKSKV